MKHTRRERLAQVSLNRVKLKFEPRDLWIGVFWNIPSETKFADPHLQTLHIYICLVPMVPLFISLRLKWVRFDKPDDATPKTPAGDQHHYCTCSLDPTRSIPGPIMPRGEWQGDFLERQREGLPVEEVLP